MRSIGVGYNGTHLPANCLDADAFDKPVEYKCCSPQTDS